MIIFIFSSRILGALIILAEIRSMFLCDAATVAYLKKSIHSGNDRHNGHSYSNFEIKDYNSFNENENHRGHEHNNYNRNDGSDRWNSNYMARDRISSHSGSDTKFTNYGNNNSDMGRNSNSRGGRRMNYSTSNSNSYGK